MDTRADDLNGDGQLPQPGTEEPSGDGDGDRVEGPGNVSVDEPTAPVLEDDNSSGGDGSDDDDDDDTSSDDDEGTSSDED